jgi:hypothetical protein
VAGYLQERGLVLVDETACRLESSREQLVLALADKHEAERYRREHGVNPRTLGGLLQTLLGH